MIEFNLITSQQAIEISQNIKGFPTENRVVLAVSTKEKQQGGIIIPGNAKEDIPKKGVIVKLGAITDEILSHQLHIGDVVQYGLYGGKEIYPTFSEGFQEPEGIKYYVLSGNEIIYIENIN